MAKPKNDEGSMTSSDPFGVGMLDDGKLNVVPPGGLAARIIERNADEEAEVDFPEEDLEDVSDLED